MVVADALKGVMPREIVEALYEECRTSYTDIIENVYRRPNANRFLASFVPFAARHIGQAEIARCVDRAFEAFAQCVGALFHRGGAYRGLAHRCNG